MAQKRKIVENKENALNEVTKKSKTSVKNKNEADSNHATTSDTVASNNENPISNNPQVLATITKTEEQTDRENDLNEKQTSHYTLVSDREKAYKALGERLQKAATSKLKTFSMSGEASDMPILLGLHVKGFGGVSLPLADPQATELIKLCKLSSRPQQAKKTINTRRATTKSDEASYELDAEQIEIKNSEWNTKLKELVSRINREYGVQLEAKLHKVEINKPGGHFIKHRDSEKDKSIFGTLIIQPPSSHTGGELVVYEANGKSKKVIDFGQKEKKSKFSVQFAAHNADLQHELFEVKSGYRLALVYSLYLIRGNEQLTNHPESSSSNELAAILEKMNDMPYPVALLLDHHYTPQSFQNKGALKVLKDVDNDRFKALKEANESLAPEKQLSIYMCKLSLEIEYKDKKGYFDEVGYITPNYYNLFAPFNPHLFKWVETDRFNYWSDWHDLDGNPVFDSLTKVPFFNTYIDMKSGLATDLSLKSNWGQPFRRVYDGYLINDGVTSTVTYSRNVLAIWPNCFEFEILLKNDINCSINMAYNEQKRNLTTLKAILNRAAHIKNLPDKTQLNEKAINQMLEILLKFNNLNYVREFIGFQKPPITLTNSSLFIKLISRFGYESLKESLFLIIRPGVDELIQNCRFIMDLHNEKSTQSVAAIFAKICLIDIINYPSNAKSIGYKIRMNQYGHLLSSWPSWRGGEMDEKTYQEDTNKQEQVLIALVKLVQLFAVDQTSEEQTMQSLAECMKSAVQGGVDRLLDEFRKEKIEVRRCEALVKILEARQRWLSFKLTERPTEFTWRMSQATLPLDEHPSMLEFLHSNSEEMIYSPPFRDQDDLEFFIYYYQGFWAYDRHYSCKITKYSGTSVLIKKTKEMFENTANEYNEYERELGCIKTFIKNL